MPELLRMFSHAQSIRAMRLLHDHAQKDIKQPMSEFRALPRVENCEIIKLEEHKIEEND